MSQTLFDEFSGVTLQTYFDLQTIPSDSADSNLLSSSTENSTAEDNDVFQCGKCKKLFNSISRFIAHKRDHHITLGEEKHKENDSEPCNEFTELRIQTLDPDDMTQPVILTDSDMLSFSLEPSSLSVSAASQLTPGSFVISPVPSEDKLDEDSSEKDAYNTDLPSPMFSSSMLKGCYKVLVPDVNIINRDLNGGRAADLNEDQDITDENGTSLTIYDRTGKQTMLVNDYSPVDDTVEFIDSGVELSSGEEAQNQFLDYSDISLLNIVQPSTIDTQNPLDVESGEVCSLPDKQAEKTSALLMKKFRPIAPASAPSKADTDPLFSPDELKSSNDNGSESLSVAESRTLSLDEADVFFPHNLQPANKLKLNCEYCSKRFAKNFDLQQHRRSHTGEKPFQCVVCGRTFSQKSNCKKHMASHKVWPKGVSDTLPKQPLYPLSKSSNSTDGENEECSEENTRDTVAECLVDKSFVCQYCPSAFDSYLALKTHMKEHSHQKVYWCIQKNCKKTFTDLDEFVSHTLSHKEGAKYRCHVCNKHFEQLAELGLHQYDHVAQTDKSSKKNVGRFRCTKCRSRFATPEGLEHHMTFSSHNYSCTYCEKSFICERYLRRHITIHGQSKNVWCPECGKGFKTVQYLNMHKLTHSADRPFRCEECSAAFTRKDKLIRHCVIHQTVKKFKCPFRNHLNCKKEFNRSDKLKLHILTHCTPKSVTCKKCNKTFKKASALRRHTHMHHSFQSYVCIYCGLNFSSKMEMDSHKCSNLKTDTEKSGESGEKCRPVSLTSRSAKTRRKGRVKTRRECKVREEENPESDDNVQSIIEIYVVPVNDEKEISDIDSVYPTITLLEDSSPPSDKE